MFLSLFAQVAEFAQANPILLVVIGTLIVLLLLGLFYYINKRRQDNELKAYAQQLTAESPALSTLVNQSNRDYTGNTSQKIASIAQEQQPRLEEVEGASEQITPIETAIGDSKGDQPIFETLEQKLEKTYFFHSKPFVNGRRYSAAARYFKIPVSEEYPTGYALVVGFAITSERDKFTRVTGRELAVKHLENNQKNFLFNTTEEELQFPGKYFTNVVANMVTSNVLTSSQRHGLRTHMASSAFEDETQEEAARIRSLIKVADTNDLLLEIDVVERTENFFQKGGYYISSNGGGVYDRANHLEEVASFGIYPPVVETQEEPTAEDSTEETQGDPEVTTQVEETKEEDGTAHTEQAI